MIASRTDVSPSLTASAAAGRTDWLLAGAFVLLVGALAVHQIFDPDFWLHLAAGQRMIADGAVIGRNLFSFTHPDHPWINVYWLWQLALAGCWSLAGAWGATLWRLALTFALAALVLSGLGARRPARGVGAFIVLLTGWLVMSPRLSDRPELASFVFLAATLTLLRSGRLWWCVPVQVVWANTQGYFYWGPLLVGLFACAECSRGNARGAWAAAAVAVAMVAACVVSPFGWNNLLLIREFGATLREFRSEIDELAGPFHPAVWRAHGNSRLLAVYAVVAGLLMARGRRQVDRYHWMIALAALPAALVSQRAAPLLVLCSLPAALECAGRTQWLERRWLRVGLAAAMVVIAAAQALGLPAGAEGPARARFGVGINRALLPEGAAAHLSRHLPPEARILNADFASGGYLIWSLRRERAVFVDGRLEAYPRAFLRRYFRLFDEPAVLEEFVAEFGLTHVLVVTVSDDTRALAARMSADARWRSVYADATATVWERVR
jgi:hypothetical protein